MTDIDKLLNIDNIISRLLEGKPPVGHDRNAVPPSAFEYQFRSVPGTDDYYFVTIVVTVQQCAVRDLARTFSCPKVKLEACASSPGRSSYRNPYCWSSRRR
ncbi:unnamed protein product [Macrosiphum euphorbiae]|uniref:Uncharacterized protein n=1 Tax=Macrosiphum euphorbiae TaxID=13131 RepID=A0AAV0WNG3_9HEMI|nr:unnamed protein product [Macrosiphum euphorbiae]